MDSVFGVGIKTDITTFKMIRDVVRSDKYDISNQKQIRAVTDYFRIEDLDGFVLEIHAPYYQMFFRELRAELTKEKCDPKVLEALRYY